MHRQVGVAKINNKGIIEKGVVIRHLVLPNNVSGTDRIMEFIARDISPETYISLMSQYMPYHRAFEFKDTSRRLYQSEYDEAKEIMQGHGLYNGWIQESYGLERFAGVHIKPNLKKDDT
jgi:putative pyruvate formate lyase activating enzyme